MLRADPELTAAHAHHAFRVQWPGSPPGEVEVEALHGVEAVNADFVFSVRVSGAPVSAPEGLVGQPLVLALGIEPDPRIVSGVITEAAAVDDRWHEGVFCLMVRSPLSRAMLTRGQHVYHAASALEIACQILREQIEQPASVRSAATQAPPERAWFVQGAETDLGFVQRILSAEGLFLLPVSGASGAEVLVLDDLAAAGQGAEDLRYQPPTGQVPAARGVIWNLRRVATRQPKSLRVAGFDPAQPQHSQAVTLAGDGSDPAELAFYGISAGGEVSHQRWAEHLQGAYQARRHSVAITTEQRLRPGMQVRITDHPDPDVNTSYWVERLIHEGEQAPAIHGVGEPRRPTYRCRAWLRPLSLGYRPMPRPAPVHGGVATATVEGPDSERAHLGDWGAYRVRLDQDRGQAPAGRASPPVPAMQPYGGGDYGCHLPLRPGTRIAVAGLHGDLEQPVIVGALSSSDQPGPVNADNPYQHVLRTAAGHELLLDDRPQQEHLRLAGAEVGSLSFRAGDGGPTVILETPEGCMELKSGGRQTLRCGGDRVLEVAGGYTVETGGAYRLTVEEGDLAWAAAEDLRLKAARDLYQTADQGTVMMEAGDGITLDAGQGVVLLSRYGDAEWWAEAGSLTLEAAGDVTVMSTGDGAIIVDNGGDGLRIEASGEIRLTGKRIDLSAQEISIVADRIAEN